MRMKSKPLWIIKDGGSGNYLVMKNKSKREVYISTFKFLMCPGVFEHVTGLKFKPGQQAKFRLVKVR